MCEKLTKWRATEEGAWHPSLIERRRDADCVCTGPLFILTSPASPSILPHTALAGSLPGRATAPWSPWMERGFASYFAAVEYKSLFYPLVPPGCVATLLAVDTLEKMRSSRQWSMLPWLPFHFPGSCHVATHLLWRWWAVGLHNGNHRRSLAWEKQLTRNTRITACHIYKSPQLTFFSLTIYAFQCQAVQIPRLFPKWTGVLGVSGAICSNKQT